MNWKSSDENIASVSDTGLVEGVAEGQVVITATSADGKLSDTCSVLVVKEKIAVSGLSLAETEITLLQGSSKTLQVNIEPADATNKSVTCSSDNESAATVTGRTITAKAVGTANIIVTTEDGGFTAQCKVTVEPVLITSIKLDKSSIAIRPQTTEQLIATVYPTDATNKNVTWTSSNTAIATVSDTGLVTGKAYGSVLVTAATENGDYKASCIVAVTKLWGEAETIVTGEKYRVENIEFAPNGNAIAIGTYYDGQIGEHEVNKIWVSHYTSSVGWSPVQFIQNTPGNHYDLRIVLDAVGNAVAMWRHWSVNHSSLWSSSYYITTDQWSDATCIVSGSYEDECDVTDWDISGDPSGIVYVMYKLLYDNDDVTLSVKKHTLAVSGWSDPYILSLEGCTDLKIGNDGNGNFISLWMKSCNIYARRYSEDTWDDAQVIGESDGYTSEIDELKFDSEGNAVVVWSQDNTMDGDYIWFSRYGVLVNSWDKNIQLNHSFDYLDYSEFSFDSEGNVMFIWLLRDRSGSGEKSICARKYLKDSVLEDSTVIKSNISVKTIRLFFDMNNTIFLLWDNGNNIYTNGWGYNYTVYSNNVDISGAFSEFSGNGYICRYEDGKVVVYKFY